MCTLKFAAKAILLPGVPGADAERAEGTAEEEAKWARTGAEAFALGRE